MIIIFFEFNFFYCFFFFLYFIKYKIFIITFFIKHIKCNNNNYLFIIINLQIKL